MLRKLLKKDEGFTLIEIVIVLAIAALIILVVLQAITAAQRAQRDNTRKQKASQLGSLITEYESNCNGYAPTGIYIGTGSTCATGGGKMEIGDYSSDQNTYWTTATNGAACTQALDSNHYEVVYQQSASTRDFALSVCLEAGGLAKVH